MKKTIIIIAAVILIAVGMILIFVFSEKECSELNEQKCKMDDRCLSTLVPCTDVDCTSDAVFKGCKSK